MYIYSFSHQFLPILRDNITYPFTNQQKRVYAIALLALSCLAVTTYTFLRCYFKAQRIDQNQEVLEETKNEESIELSEFYEKNKRKIKDDLSNILIQTRIPRISQKLVLAVKKNTNKVLQLCLFHWITDKMKKNQDCYYFLIEEVSVIEREKRKHESIYSLIEFTLEDKEKYALATPPQELTDIVTQTVKNFHLLIPVTNHY